MKKFYIYTLIVFLISNAALLFAQKKATDMNVIEPISEIINQAKNENSTGVTLLYDIDLPYNGIIEIEYDSIREGLWLAREDDGIIYLVDLPDGNIMMEVDAASIGLPDGKYEGIELLPNGNILLAEMNGDAGVTINAHILEINPEDGGTLISYWPTTGIMNTSTDGTEIPYLLGVSVGDNGNIYASSGLGDDLIYEIATTPGLPGTWETVELHSIPTGHNIVGVDRLEHHWGLTDWWSNNVMIMNEDFDTVFTFKSTHYAVDFNFGITFIEGTTPLNIAVHTAFGRIGFYVIDPCSSITCMENQEVMASESGFYTVIGNEFDALIVDTCGMGITNINNDFNYLETLEGAELPIGETTITWSFSDDFGNYQECSFIVMVDIYDGATDLSKTNFSIYPNPTNGLITVNSEEQEIENIEMTDISGKLIYTKIVRDHTATINLSNQPAGYYLLKTQTEKEIFIEKIIKN